MYKILKNIIEMDDYSVQKLSNLQPPEPFEWNTVEGTELNVSDCIGGKGRIEVKGNTEQEQLSGKNKLPLLDTETRTNSGITCTYNKERDSYIFNGTCTKDNISFVISKKDISVNSGTIISAHWVAGNCNNYCRFRVYDADYLRNVIIDITALSKETPIVSGSSSANFISPAEKISIRFNEGSVCNNFEVRFMIADTTDTTYEPYCGGQASPNPDYPQEIEVVTGDNVVKHTEKNLFDKDNANIINTGISSKVISTSEYNRMLYIPVKSSTTYTIQRRNDGDVNRFRVGSCTVIPANNVSVPNAIEKDNATNITITTGANDKYLAVMYYRTYETVLTEQQILNSIQIEENTTPTSYEPYREEEYELSLGTIELCKIGDYKDILFKNEAGDENYNAELENGAWYKKGVIDKYVYNNNLSSNGINENRVQMLTPTLNISESLSNEQLASMAYCNIMKTSLIGHTGLDGTTVSNKIRISISLNYVSTFDKFRALCEKKNLTIYFVAKTPTYTKITNPTLISQLEALNKAKWFKGVNHWWTETNNLEPVLKGTYRQAINE